MLNVFVFWLIILLAILRVNGVQMYYWIIPASIGWLIGVWMIGRAKIIDYGDNPQVSTVAPMASVYFYTAILLITIERLCVVWYKVQ